jgi:hypothetical protein
MENSFQQCKQQYLADTEFNFKKNRKESFQSSMHVQDVFYFGACDYISKSAAQASYSCKYYDLRCGHFCLVMNMVMPENKAGLPRFSKANMQLVTIVPHHIRRIKTGVDASDAILSA